ERPGATHLELPQDIAGDPTQARLIPASFSRRPVAEDKAIERAAEAIAQARHPILMIGAGANRKTTSKTLEQFVAKLGIPYFTT
ncbi:acetolactate synthase large subunit, partial [Streptomyces sp. S9]|nr:acetolactate synthase large subunit [Streptomyces sp. S9]